MQNWINIVKIDSEFFSDDIEAAVLIENESAQDTEEKIRAKRKFIRRDFEIFDNILFQDYFAENPRYSSKMFERRYRMSKKMFLDICDGLKNEDSYFELRYNAAGQRGLSTIQKCTAALRLLAYGNSADSIDEYLKIGESTSLQILRKFCECIIKVYGQWYLRSPNENDVKTLMEENSKRGFPGMLGSIDCMHYFWKNCPVAHKGQFQGKEGKPSIVLEAVASYNLHIWHCFFGLPGSLNDINVLDRSPFVDNVINERIPKVPYIVNGVTRDIGYWLADGIYPDWPIFMKTITNPANKKLSLFAQKQESVRKDVERAFGVLQSQWGIIRNPGRLWDVISMSLIVQTCIILHNMNIEYSATETENLNIDGQSDNIQSTINHVDDLLLDSSNINNSSAPQGTFAWLLQSREKIKNRHDFVQLQNDLISHIWEIEGSAS